GRRFESCRVHFTIRRNTQVWLKGTVLKTERGVKACGGSNPSSSSIHNCGSIAQSVEQRTENPCVGGSIPSRAINKHGICLFFYRLKPTKKMRNSCSRRKALITLKYS